jgi:hypothetical protein
MRLWTLIKLLSGVAVLGIAIFTGMLVWHVQRTPLGGIFSELLPTEVHPKPISALPKADAEMLAVGDLAGALERLRNVVSIYPRSKSAPEARRIVGEMNLDELLSTSRMEGKSVHIVRSGESFLGIAAQHSTTLDCIMHLNGLLDLKGLQPSEELIVMPLELRVVIEPGRKALSLWEGGRFIKDYALLSASIPGPKVALRTTIASKSGLIGDRRVTPGMKDYRESAKIFSLDKSSLQIRSVTSQPEGSDSAPAPGFHLAAEDAEELSLLLRPGNEVEICITGP